MVEKRQRTKCFTGCWTCRSRRIKCDEDTPSCQRCRQVGIECEGYGLRLNWVQCNPHDTYAADQHQDPESSLRASRRSLPSAGGPGAFPCVPRLASPELDAALANIDEWCPGELSSNLEKGGFCVFSVEKLPTNSGIELDTRPQDSVPTSPLPSRDPQKHQDAICVEPRQTDRSISPRHREVCLHPPPRHLNALSMPSNQTRLIHHWVTFTSRKLVLFDEPHSPCRTMMLPMALKGLVSDGSSADVAIFHALCAAAAYNLFELTDRTNEQDRVLALYHDNEAVRHLRHNLATADEDSDMDSATAIAMAIMACIAVEAVSGTTQRWRTHVSGGLAYLAKLQSQGLDEAALSAFQQHMVKMAILCSVPVPDCLKSFLHDESGSSDGLEFTFPYYGVSRSFLRAHDRVNVLLATSSSDIPTPRTPAIQNELNVLELQMYLDFPGLPPQDLALAAAGKHNAVILHHTAKAFYYAGLVYFKRSVHNTAPAQVQDLVELGIQELESIDRAGQGALGCLMLWPVLVLGAECAAIGMQQRMRAWFHAQRRLGFRNLVVLEELVAIVWKARADPRADVEDSDWRQVILHAPFDVFRL